MLQSFVTTSSDIDLFFEFFTDKLSRKIDINWLKKILPHVDLVPTLPWEMWCVCLDESYLPTVSCWRNWADEDWCRLIQLRQSATTTTALLLHRYHSVHLTTRACLPQCQPLLQLSTTTTHYLLLLHYYYISTTACISPPMCLCLPQCQPILQLSTTTTHYPLLLRYYYISTIACISPPMCLCLPQCRPILQL